MSTGAHEGADGGGVMGAATGAVSTTSWASVVACGRHVELHGAQLPPSVDTQNRPLIDT